jgi:2-methylcitrate dehydratase PrpD
VSPEQISETRLKDHRILTQVGKIEVFDDPEVQEKAPFPNYHAASIQISTVDGNQYKSFKYYPRGGKQNPLSESDLCGKFRKLSEKALGSEKTDTLEKYINDLEQIDDIDKVISLFRSM